MGITFAFSSGYSTMYDYQGCTRKLGWQKTYYNGTKYNTGREHEVSCQEKYELDWRTHSDDKKPEICQKL